MSYTLTDTHCHITCDRLFARIDEVIANAKAHHIGRMLIICTNLQEYERAQQLKDKEDIFDIALGFHPCDLYDVKEADFERLEQLLKADRLVAVGEIGLDYHWDDVAPKDQKQGFRRQIALAQAYDKPILIHMREATKDTLDILRETGMNRGVFHCYSGSVETAKEAVAMGFYISFAGPLTFKNARGAPEVCAQLPLERLLVETDCPYLTPHPYRGKENEPMYAEVTFNKMREIRQMEKAALAAQLEENYQRLFKKG